MTRRTMNDAPLVPGWECEDIAMSDGFTTVAGIDEAGRGPLAGAVFAAAVILPPHIVLPGVNDSKKLCEKRRAELEELIMANAVCFAVASASPQEIDELNILNATMLAMSRAASALKIAPELLLIDGNHARNLPIAARAIVKGDARSMSIAAASILAKTARDTDMLRLDAEYPGYGFAAHKGYPTKAHYLALRELGPSPVHRASFLKKNGGKNAAI